MKKLLCAAGLMVLLCPTSSAQALQGREVSGAIYLSDGTEIITAFIYHEKEQVMVEKKATGLEVYTTFHVDSFFFYDPELMWQRRFRKMKYRGREHFFETVTPGEVSILRIRMAHSAPESMIANDTDCHRLNYRYFVLYQDKLHYLKYYHWQKLHELFPGHWTTLLEFARKQNINFYKMSDKIQLIRKLNAILAEKETFSLK
jgi:hypothetical protein